MSDSMWSNGFNVSIVVVVFFALAEQQPTYLYSFVRVQVFQFKWVFFFFFVGSVYEFFVSIPASQVFGMNHLLCQCGRAWPLLPFCSFDSTQRFSSFQVKCKAQKHKAIMLLTNRENNYPMDLGFNIVASIIIISSSFSTFTSKS